MPSNTHFDSSPLYHGSYLQRFRCTAPNAEHSVPISGKRPYLSRMADNQKNKGTLLSQTLKVGEKKVPIFTNLFASNCSELFVQKIYMTMCRIMGIMDGQKV